MLRNLYKVLDNIIEIDFTVVKIGKGLIVLNLICCSNTVELQPINISYHMRSYKHILPP